MEQAKQAYEAYVTSLEGKAPAGLAAPPYDLQAWEQLPARVREAWVAAAMALAPPPAPPPEPEAAGAEGAGSGTSGTSSTEPVN
jgi:hypothetical protein